jgi:hypothetical protein
MGVFSVVGYDDATAGRIRKMWQLKQGDVYDASYLKVFVGKGLPVPPGGGPGGKTHLAFSARPNVNTLVVDVALSVVTN